MGKKSAIDGDTRFFVDLDLETNKIIGWDYGQREKLAVTEIPNLFQHRIFISKGQYNKLTSKSQQLRANATI